MSGEHQENSGMSKERQEIRRTSGEHQKKVRRTSGEELGHMEQKSVWSRSASAGSSYQTSCGSEAIHPYRRLESARRQQLESARRQRRAPTPRRRGRVWGSTKTNHPSQRARPRLNPGRKQSLCTAPPAGASGVLQHTQACSKRNRRLGWCCLAPPRGHL